MFGHFTEQYGFVADLTFQHIVRLKPKLEAMVQSVTNIQELYAKALLVNREKLQAAQAAGDIVAAEEALRRAEMGVPADPFDALRASGIIAKRAAERKADQSGRASFA